MAYVEPIRAAAGHPEGTLLERLVAAYNRRVVYTRTVRELNQLSARELADLGIHRSAIRGLAREAAYGN